jgi:hypothetical protein
MGRGKLKRKLRGGSAEKHQTGTDGSRLRG